MSGTTPKAWSYTGLKQFVDCPRQFYEVRVAKSVPDTVTKERQWGEYVHKCFEDRMKDGKPLPPELEEHEEILLELTTLRGVQHNEVKIALDTSGQPCDFFARRPTVVWFRGVIDHRNICGDRARLVDYKTGKPHSDFDQLALFALHTFAAFPEVEVCNTGYYWLNGRKYTPKTFTRADIDAIWQKFIPWLTQYRDAFKTDTWQPRRSGLCRGWCPVKECEFWSPKEPHP